MITFNKLSKKETAYIATFGTLWGVCEITLGMILHNFHIPLTGLLLTAIGAIIALTCARLTDKKRAIFYTAIIAAILKLLSITTVKIIPFLSIIFSALTAQCILYLFRITPAGFIFSAGIMCCWPLIFLVISQSITFSTKIFEIYQNLLYSIGLKSLSILTVFCFGFIISFIIGGSSGLLAWFISNELIERRKTYIIP